MPLLETAGRFAGLVKSAEFGESGNGSPYVFVTLETSETDPAQTIGAWLYLTEKALPHTVKTLREAFGFNGDFETLPKQITGKPCSFTTEYEEDNEGNERLKVKWINGPRTTKPIENKAEFLKSLSAKAARIPVAAAKAAPTRAPAAQRPPAAQPPAAAQPAPAAKTGNGDPF